MFPRRATSVIAVIIARALHDKQAMNEIELHIRPADESAIARIDDAIASCGLLTTMKATLKSYPGCTHWHCKHGNEKGTLEITLDPARSRAWFKVQEQRRAPWIDQVIPTLKRMLENRNTARHAGSERTREEPDPERDRSGPSRSTAQNRRGGSRRN
jgi:hypothetical protein